MRFKALIDKKYADEVRQYRWYGTVNDGGIYASSDIDGKRIYLQNFIYEKKTGIKAHGVSFENKVLSDCRFANLRGVSRTEVMNNRRPKINTASKFKGIRWDPVTEKWRVEIRRKGEYFYLGRFDKEKEEFAAKVYDAAASKLMVGSAYLNFPLTLN